MELIRTENFLGNDKTIVGNKMADLVLETLGKVYIKTGRNLKLLDDLFRTTVSSDSKAKIIITNGDMESMDYPGDGYFVYDALTSILYISYQGRYIALIVASEFTNSSYVKKTGDEMSGQLKMNTSAAPFIIASNEFVKNLNVEYINGYNSGELAKKKVDEAITGSWTFTNKGTSEDTWTFKDNTRHYGDMITSGNLSTPEFVSGFNGYGWRLDGTTNTLTIDYLVVRKAMRVYEMVINKISATNGSLWITNSSKCESAVQPVITDGSDLHSGNYYIFKEDCITQTVSGEALSSSTEIGTSTTFTDYKHLFYIKNYEALSKVITDISDIYLQADSDNYPYKEYVTVYSITTDLTNASFPIYLDDEIVYIQSYYKYFGNNNYWVIGTDKNEYSLFKEGDIIRCQKYTGGNIKYYDALIVKQLDDRLFLLKKANSVFDVYSEIKYDKNGDIESNIEKQNTTQYSRTDTEDILDNPAVGDDMIQIGNLVDVNRQNAIYLTSTDDQGPYIDVISGLNRPDYSAIYDVPNYVKMESIQDGIKKSYYISFTQINNAPKIGTYKNGDEEQDVYGYDFPSKSLNCITNGHQYTKTTRVRVGNLSGIYNKQFGDKQPYGYGLYAENVFLTGEFYLNNGKSVVDVSQEGILLKFNDAGLVIGEITDESGNKSSMIELNADKVFIKNGDKNAALFENGKIKAEYIEVDNVDANKLVAIKEIQIGDTLVHAVSATINEEDNGMHYLYYDPVLAVGYSDPDMLKLPNSIIANGNYIMYDITGYRTNDSSALYYVSQRMRADYPIYDPQGIMNGIKTVYYDRYGGIREVINKYDTSTIADYNVPMLHIPNSTVSDMSSVVTVLLNQLDNVFTSGNIHYWNELKTMEFKKLSEFETYSMCLANKDNNKIISCNTSSDIVNNAMTQNCIGAQYNASTYKFSWLTDQNILYDVNSRMECSESDNSRILTIYLGFVSVIKDSTSTNSLALLSSDQTDRGENPTISDEDMDQAALNQKNTAKGYRVTITYMETPSKDHDLIDNFRPTSRTATHMVGMDGFDFTYTWEENF